jgi:hypothetical protein
MKKTIHLIATAALIGAASTASAQQFNEIYASHTGTDTSEYIELRGTPNASLTNYLILVVEGDVGGGAGTLDRAYDLSGQSIQASGLFVIGAAALTPPPNLAFPNTQDNLENGTETFYLVTATNPAAIQALVGTDVSNGAGSTTTSLPTLTTIIDSAALADSGITSGDITYDGAPVFGPDGTFFPSGIYRCGDAPFGWSTLFLNFDPASTGGVPITPGSPNQACGTTPTGVPFCFGDGTGTACPCGNASPVGNEEGCLTSFGVGGKLVASGTPSIANDTVILLGSQMPNSSALYFQGTTQAGGGAGTAFGDGLRCAAGAVIRLGTKTNGATPFPPNSSQYPAAGDPSISVRGLVTVPGVRTYQVWFRNAAAFCTPSAFNLTNGYEINWVP